MSMLVISTQVLENYGAHDWNGEGECPQYWKAKGGRDHKVLGIDTNRAQEIFESVVGRVTEDNDYFQEYVVNWFVESDDYLSLFEKNQLEYEGRINYLEPTIDWHVDKTFD